MVLLAVLALVLATLPPALSPTPNLCVGRLSGTFPYRLPCFTVESAGFRLGDSGPEVLFCAPVMGAVLPSSGWTEKVIAGPGSPGAPEKIRLHIALPALDVAFGQRMELRLKGWKRGYLSWPGGSVGEGVPAPTDQSWVLLSGEPASPCIAIHFSSARTELMLTREGEILRLRATAPRIGWVRLMTPLGLENVSSRSARELGELVERVRSPIQILAQTAPAPPEVRWVPEEGFVRVVESAGVVPPLVPTSMLESPSERLLRLRTEEGMLALSPEACVYRLRVPVATLPFPVPTAPSELQALLRGPNSLLDLAKLYDLRFHLSDQEQQTLRERLASRAEEIAEPANWETWTEPNSRQPVPRLKWAWEAPLEQHLEAAAVLIGALDMCRPEPVWKQSLLACIKIMELHLDWASWQLLTKGQLVRAAVTRQALDVSSRALLFQWSAAESSRIAHLAARLAHASSTTGAIEATHLPIFCPPPGRLLRYEYHSTSGTLHLRLAAGPAITLGGEQAEKIRSVSIGGGVVALQRHGGGRWSVAVPASQRVTEVEIRIAPKASDETSEDRRVPDNLR